MSQDRRTWRYRRVGTEIESRLFDNPESVPVGWANSPAAVDENKRKQLHLKVKTDRQD